MLEYIKITNYQSHENTQLDFSPGVNVITGKSQNGKTAILRSIYWLLFGKPSGFRFHSNFTAGTDPTEVELKAEGFPSILAYRSNKASGYIIGKEEFEGTTVPDKVNQILNLDSLNIQGQLDEHFLITSSPGEVARVINKITRLERVADWVASLGSKINKENKNVDFCADKIEEGNEELRKYSELDSLEKLVLRYESVFAECDKLQERMVSLDLIAREIASVGKVLEDEELYRELVSGIYEVMVDVDAANRKKAFLLEYNEIEKEIEFLEENIQGVDLLLRDAMLMVEESKSVEEKIESLSELAVVLGELGETVDSLEMERRELKDRYGKALKDLGKCPTCFSVVNDQVLEKIIESL